MNSAGVGGYFQGGASFSTKLIQKGTIDLNGVASATATITSVDTANATLHYLGRSGGIGSAQQNDQLSKLALTNATTVTVDRFGTQAVAHVTEYTVRELRPGIYKLIQRGTIELNGVTSATATITSVSTGKALAAHLGHEINAAANLGPGSFSTVDLTNATTVTATVPVLQAVSSLVGYQVEETYA